MVVEVFRFGLTTSLSDCGTFVLASQQASTIVGLSFWPHSKPQRLWDSLRWTFSPPAPCCALLVLHKNQWRCYVIIRCCTVSNVVARPPHALRHSAFGIIRTAVKMRVDRGIRFLGREEIEHLDFPSWISSRVQRKLGISARRGEMKLRAIGRSGGFGAGRARKGWG